MDYFQKKEADKIQMRYANAAWLKLLSTFLHGFKNLLELKKSFSHIRMSRKIDYILR